MALQALLNRYSGQLMSYLAAAVTATSRFALQVRTSRRMGTTEGLVDFCRLRLTLVDFGGAACGGGRAW